MAVAFVALRGILSGVKKEQPQNQVSTKIRGGFLAVLLPEVDAETTSLFLHLPAEKKAFRTSDGLWSGTSYAFCHRGNG